MAAPKKENARTMGAELVLRGPNGALRGRRFSVAVLTTYLTLYKHNSCNDGRPPLFFHACHHALRHSH
jgi:hypothetical protein